MVIENFNSKNQYMIKYDNKIIFQSYDTTMFIYDDTDKTITFNKYDTNYTQTTCKYLRLALEYIADNYCWSSKLRDLIESNNRKAFILSISSGVFKLYD